VDLANALDLSESEEEEELEDLIEDFALQADLEQVRLPPKSVL
jgi:DNA-directed RNA polymerase III subunit RPC4